MLRNKLQSDQISALKNKEQNKLTTLRYILAQIKNKEIDKNPPAGGELTDEEIISILRKIVKELHESITAFQKGGRTELVEEYQKQLEIVSAYLPSEMSDEDLKKEIENIIANNQDIYNQNKKAIIGVCMKALRSRVSPDRIMKILQSMTA